MRHNTRKKYRIRRGSPLPGLLLLILVISASIFFIPRFLGLAGDCSGGGEIAQSVVKLIPPTPIEVAFEDVYSPCALLIRRSDGAVLFEKNSTQQTYPASLTKVMTVITFLENYKKEGESESDQQERLKSESFTLPPDIFPFLAAKHASMAGFQPGETVSMLDLLYGSLLPSGADGSMGLAYSMAGSEQGFVDMMNAKAKELGMKDTHWANVTGLHDSQHYTTAKDLSLLLEHALKNDTFRRIFTTDKHEIAATNLHPEGFTVQSILFYKMENPQVNRTTVLGGKTGYTGEAGLCLASLASKGSNEYILITTNAPGNAYTDPFHIIDAETIYGAL